MVAVLVVWTGVPVGGGVAGSWWSGWVWWFLVVVFVLCGRAGQASQEGYGVVCVQDELRGGGGHWLLGGVVVPW